MEAAHKWGSFLEAERSPACKPTYPSSLGKETSSDPVKKRLKRGRWGGGEGNHAFGGLGAFLPPGKVQTYPGRVLTEANSGSAAASCPGARHTPPCRGPSLQDRDTHTPSHVCTIAGAAAAADAEIPEVPPCCWQVMQAALAGAASSSSASASFLVGFSRTLRSHALIPLLRLLPVATD